MSGRRIAAEDEQERTMNVSLIRATLVAAAAASVTGALVWHGLSQADPSASARSPFGTGQICTRYSGLPSGFGHEPRAGMVRVPSGEFEPGSTQGYPDERPAGRVRVEAFWIDRTEVTNAQFAAFVAATGYVTEAEREGGAAVFKAPRPGESIAYNGWWSFVNGANWRHPEGPRSDVDGRANHPVVHVTRADAEGYARWLGRELPTEAQWEWAARAGGRGELLEREPRSADGKSTANYWQGVFPDLNTREDGYADRAPVGCYPANGYGLHDLIGNVWEWTRDPYRGPRQPHGNGDPSAAAARTESTQAPYVIKGGSFLCAADYCVRYRAAGRHPQEASLGAAHVGFRTVARDALILSLHP
jgi:formylglycine-generating enzyme required for sulfatase activity